MASSLATANRRGHSGSVALNACVRRESGLIELAKLNARGPVRPPYRAACNGARRIALHNGEANIRRPHMEKDVVCGMQVDPAKAAGTSQYNGKTYYFCSSACKAKFDADPAKFAK
jgi:YHS domain-containing protein